MSYAEVQSTKKGKAVDFAKVPLFVYKGSDPAYRRELATGHVYIFLPRQPQPVMNVTDLKQMLDIANSNKSLFTVGIGFWRLSQRAYNNISHVLKEAEELLKEAGFAENHIKTVAEKELQAKLKKEKAGAEK